MLNFYAASNERGVAIIAVTLVMTVIVLLGSAIVTQTSQDVQLTDRTYGDKQALYMAESAKERGYREIMNDNNFTTLGNVGVINNIPVGGGSYNLVATTLQDSPLPKVVQIAGTGTTDQTTRQITVVSEVIRENVCVWNNAIFGGSGQAGGVINGNSAIHGSVHLLGENVGEGNNSVEALDLIGNSLVHNNYEGMPADLRALVPALPTTVFGGETIDTLDAKLRIKNGAVGLSGSSEIGQADVVGNGFKETMDGIYIETDLTDLRWTGNQVVDGVPDPNQVFSDNGTDALYDLGDAVQLPRYDDPYPGYTDYEDYFSSNSLHLPSLVLDESSSAATAIAGYTFPAGITVTVNGDSFTLTDGTNTLSYDPTPAAGDPNITIDGMITIDGDLAIGEKKYDITYSGKGTVYASDSGGDAGDIEFHSNFLPHDIFPTVDVMGFMAKNDINLATGNGDSNLDMAGAFYGGHQIVSTKQNDIAGTFVCDYFDMGHEVPSIFQVPSLADNLPPGIIGSDPIWVTTGFEERSWRVD